MVCLYCPTPRELGSMIMYRNVFTVPTPKAMRISIGFCTHFIGIGIGIGLGVGSVNQPLVGLTLLGLIEVYKIRFT